MLRGRTWDRRSPKGIIGLVLVLIGLVLVTDSVIDVVERNSCPTKS